MSKRFTITRNEDWVMETREADTAIEALEEYIDEYGLETVDNVGGNDLYASVFVMSEYPRDSLYEAVYDDREEA